MKTITRKISLLLMLGAVLFLGSCLDSSGDSYILKEVSYITQGETTGIIYARTLSGFRITSPKIKQLEPGTMAILSFQVRTSEDETVLVDENTDAFVVELGEEPEVLDQTTLISDTAPDIPAVKFESLMDPVFAQNDYFGDLWIFPYTYKIKKGENVKVKFYIASEEDAATANIGVLIDVRLEKLGTPEEGATEKREGDNIVVNLSELRTLVSDKADVDGKLNIKFRYYREENENLIITNNTYLMHVGTI